MLGPTIQRQLPPKRRPSPSLRSQGGLPSGGEAGVQAYLVRNAKEQVSEGEIAGLCPLREHEVARQERHRRHQAVSSKGDVEGAGPGRRGLRNHSNGEEDRLAKSYLGDISEGRP